MKDRQISKHGDFQIATAKGASGRFIAWGKMGKIVADDPVTEPGNHVWFQSGATREDAKDKLLDELGLKHG